MAISKRKNNLPVKPLDLQKWILVGKAKLAAQLRAIKGIKQLEEGQAAVAAALSDTQDLAEELLYAEAQLGSMLEPDLSKRRASSAKGTCTLPPAITKKQSHYAQELSRNEDSIARVVAKAREQDEVPVRQHVLRDIRLKNPKVETRPIPKDKYTIVYADPPWQYRDKMTEKYGTAEHHYATMSIQELCNLPIKNNLAKNAVLFLWVTSPLLSECWSVIDAWGFEYKASFVWDKIKDNYGHYNSVRHEFLLICTRGSCLPQTKKQNDSVISIERTKHSEKPEYFRKLICSMYPQGRKLELFGRKKVDGWTVYGNEV